MPHYYLSQEKYKWYYLLIGRNAESNFSRGLLDDYPDTEGKLIVCAQVNENERYFCLFETHLDFIEYYRTIQEANRNYYEVILGQHPQKPHFDLDFEVDPNSEVNLDSAKVKSEEILEAVITGIIQTLAEKNISLNFNKDLLIYTSHGPTKHSYHLVITNYCHTNNQEAKEFYNQVLAKVPEKIRNKKLIDSSVYSTKQQFRILYSTKPGKNRPKILLKTFKYQNQEYTHKYIAEITGTKKEALEFLYSLEESFVSVTNNCIFLPNFLSEQSVEAKIFKSGYSVQVSNLVAVSCLALLNHWMKADSFGIMKIQDGLIILKSKKSYKCLICKRIHEHENPYLSINVYSLVKYHCRRANTNLALGYIEDIEQKQKVNQLNQKIQDVDENREDEYVFYQGKVEDKKEVINSSISAAENKVTNTDQNPRNTEKKPIPPKKCTMASFEPIQISNVNPIEDLKEVASLTMLSKPKKILTREEEVVEIFDRTTSTPDVEPAHTDLDDLWS